MKGEKLGFSLDTKDVVTSTLIIVFGQFYRLVIIDVSRSVFSKCLK